MPLIRYLPEKPTEFPLPVSHPPSSLVWLPVAAVLVWRFYARIRRTIGRQKFSQKRPWITLSVFPVLIVVLLFGARAAPLNDLALLAGILVGIPLGLWGMKLTKFEPTPAGLFYTPNLHLGIALSVLFMGRVVYRIVQINASIQPVFGSPVDFGRSPLTLAIFGTLAGYYMTYAIGLLRWSRRIGNDAGMLEKQATLE